MKLYLLVIWAQTVTSTRCTGQGGLDTGPPTWPWGWSRPQESSPRKQWRRRVLRRRVSQKKGVPQGPGRLGVSPTGPDSFRDGVGGARCWICIGLLIGLFLVVSRAHQCGIEDFILEKMHEVVTPQDQDSKAFPPGGLVGIAHDSSQPRPVLSGPQQHSVRSGSCLPGVRTPQTPRTISLFRVMINLTVATSGSFRGTSICMHFSLIFPRLARFGVMKSKDM